MPSNVPNVLTMLINAHLVEVIEFCQIVLADMDIMMIIRANFVFVNDKYKKKKKLFIFFLFFLF